MNPYFPLRIAALFTALTAPGTLSAQTVVTDGTDFNSALNAQAPSISLVPAAGNTITTVANTTTGTAGTVTYIAPFAGVIGFSTTINGNGNTLSGSSNATPLFVTSPANETATGGVTVPTAYSVDISNLTVSGGTSAGGGVEGGGGAGLGGGLFVGTGATVTLTNVNFSGNSASGGSTAGGASQGAGGIGGTAFSNGFNAGGGGLFANASGGNGGGANGGSTPGQNGGFGGGGAMGASGTSVFSGSGPAGNGGPGGAGGFGAGGSFGGGGGFTFGSGSPGNGGQGGAGGFGGGGGRGGNPGFSMGGGGQGVFGPGGQGGFGGGGGAGTINGLGGVGGGDASAVAGGGGGAGFGGAIFVQNGSALILTGNDTLSGDTVTAGTGDNNGAAAGSEIFMMTGSTVTLAPGNGNVVTIGASSDTGSDIADDSASSLPTGQSYEPGTAAGAALTIGNNATPGGTVILNGANTYAGGISLTNGAILQVNNAAAVGAGTIGFSGGTLKYGTGITHDFSSQFSNAVNQQYSVDTNGNNVSFATALTSNSGSFTKSGTGTLTLTTINTYTNGTTISGGTLALAVGGSIAGSSGVNLSASGATFDITNGGNQTIGYLNGVSGSTVNLGANVLTESTSPGNSPASTTFSGVIQGVGGSLVQTGSGGELNITGANTYSGGTTISGGTLKLGDGFDAGASLGSGDITVNGTGTLTVDLAGGDTLTNHIIDDNAVVLDDFIQGNYAVSGLISGSGTVTKTGGNTITLTHANSYTGGTTLTSGTLIAGNSAAFGTGPMQVNGGTLTVGNNNHLIAVSSYAQTAGTLSFNVTGVGQAATADQLHITNTNVNQAALGGVLSVNLGSFSAPMGSGGGTFTFDLVVTDAGHTGTFTFDPLNVGSGLTATLDYTTIPDDVLLQIVQAAGTFTLTGLSSNQQAIGGNINRNLTGGALGTLSTALGNAVTANPSALGTYLNQLSPQAFGQFTSSTAFNNASFATEAKDQYAASRRAGANGSFVDGNGSIDASRLTLNDPAYDSSLALVHSRMLAWNPAPIPGLLSDTPTPVLGGVDMSDPKTMRSAPAYDNPWNFYVQGTVILAQGFSQQDVSHFDGNTESVTLGTDYRVTPNLLVGLAAGYGHTDATLDNNGSSATVDSYSPGFYVSYADKGWYANLSGDYIHNAYTQDRVIGFLGQTASSAPEGNEGVANLDGGYDFHHGALTYGPLAGVQYTHLTVDGYNESGSIADLSVNEQDADSLRSRLGGRVSYAFVHGGRTFTPHLDASWQHEFLDQGRGITSQFNGGVGSFSVRTTNPSRDSALVDAGLDAEINQTVTVFTDYAIQAGQDNYFGQSVQAGAKIGF